MLKHPARHYDDYLKLRVSPLLWLALFYGVRHFFLLAASKLMPLETSATPWIVLQAQPGLLWADLPVLLVLIATGHRIPDALRLMRWLWLHGRSVLIAAYCLAMAGFVVVNRSVLTVLDNTLAAAIILLTDAAFIVLLARSELVKDIFAEFPDQAETKPAPRPVSSERELAEEVARNRQQALLAEPVLRDVPSEVFPVKPGEPVQSALEAAARYEAQNRWSEAESVYRSLLAANPGCADAWHAFGLLAFQAGHRDHGIALVEEAMRLDGQSGLFRRNACEMARREGRLEDAIRYGELACRLSPKDAEAHNYLGLALTNARQFDRAAEAFRKTIEQNSLHPMAWNNLGVALQAGGRGDEADQAYRKALSVNPEHREALANLDRLQRAENQKEYEVRNRKT